MEALLLTVGLILLMIVTLTVLARGWPRSSRLGGYRARNSGRRDAAPAPDKEQGEPIREDDDVRWRWKDPS